jgi:hypothetical protein
MVHVLEKVADGDYHQGLGYVASFFMLTIKPADVVKILYVLTSSEKYLRYVCVFMRLYVCMYVCIYVCLHACICMHVCLYIRGVCVCVYIYIYTVCNICIKILYVLTSSEKYFRYVCVFMRLYVCKYVCIRVYIHSM